MIDRLYEWETRVWALYMHLLERRPVPSLYAEYRDGGPFYEAPWITEPHQKVLAKLRAVRKETCDQFEENGT